MAAASRRSVYFRPIVGLGVDTRYLDAHAKGSAAQLCGRPDLVFTHVEIIQRHSAHGDGAGRELVRASMAGRELHVEDFATPGEHDADAAAIKATKAALVSPRPPFAGLDMNHAAIMGIVNVTPDSFSDGGRHDTTQAAIDHGLKLADEGADILDIGGESTRPGSDAVPVEEELRRVIAVIEGLRGRTDKKISVDTRKAEVMREAAQAGADILNDVSALTHDPKALEAAAESGLPVMLMHAQGDPKTMNDNPRYDNVVLDVFDFLEARIRACEAVGITRDKIVVDPGIGFGKHLHHNVAVLSAMSLYHGLGVPVLLGASRKKLIGQICNVEDAKARVPGSLAAALSSIAQGVQIVRVHDVAATRQAIAVWQAALAGTEEG